MPTIRVGDFTVNFHRAKSPKKQKPSLAKSISVRFNKFFGGGRPTQDELVKKNILAPLPVVKVHSLLEPFVNGVRGAMGNFSFVHLLPILLFP